MHSCLTPVSSCFLISVPQHNCIGQKKKSSFNYLSEKVPCSIHSWPKTAPENSIQECSIDGSNWSKRIGNWESRCWWADTTFFVIHQKKVLKIFMKSYFYFTWNAIFVIRIFIYFNFPPSFLSSFFLDRFSEEVENAINIISWNDLKKIKAVGLFCHKKYFW